jgi:hypothetical protein
LPVASAETTRLFATSRKEHEARNYHPAFGLRGMSDRGPEDGKMTILAMLDKFLDDTTLTPIKSIFRK